MASHVLSQKCGNAVPLPSHFHSNIHTTAAFDNFDHNEHTPSGSSHDTAAIVIQDEPAMLFTVNQIYLKHQLAMVATNSLVLYPVKSLKSFIEVLKI